MARICLVGSWHQALVYGAGLADVGHDVTGVCETNELAAAFNAARPVVHEQGLPELMRRNIKRKRLRYTSQYGDALKRAQFAYISIDTPVRQDDTSDLTGIEHAAREIGRHRHGTLVLCVSAQVPVGTTHALADLARGESRQDPVSAAYVPEFLRLGTALETFFKADRFVIGADELATQRRVAALYRKLKRPIITTDVKTAEMAKHGSNTFLATSISFINEIANLCEEVGADAAGVASILKADRRIGPHAFLSPGLGFAGGTLGREVIALQRIGSTRHVPTPLMDAVLTVNLGRAAHVKQRLEESLGGLAGRRIGVLGLTYKAGTSTMRRALSLDIVRALVEAGAEVKAYDPLANLGELANAPPLARVLTPYEAASGADALLLITEWKDIDRLNLPRLRKMMRGSVFLDTRNLYDTAVLARAGFNALSIGRPAPRDASRV